MNSRRTIIALILLVTSINSYSQNYILENEELIFSFDTKKGKHMVLAKGKMNEYIIYRFGTKNKIEFEFPNKSKDSWTKFKYSYWLRGGGSSNSGIDLNYIYFTNKDFRYVVYDTYFSEKEEYSIGIRITNLKTNETISIKGDKRKQKGTLVDFRENNLLEMGDELFD